MAYRVALALVVVAALGVVVGCGGKGSGAGASTTVPEIKPSQQQFGGAGVDPDQTPMGSSDATAVVRRLGTHQFQLLVQNLSATGFIDTFEWKPVGLTVTAVIRSSRGSCRLSGRLISCTKASLRPPTCLCRPGGSMTVDFKANYGAGDTKTSKFGVQDSALWVGAMTVVPYVIPAHSGGELDLPVCAKGQQSTSAQPCASG
jgi:hypothetical protein